MTDEESLEARLYRVFNDDEDRLAQQLYGERAHEEWANLAPADKEPWTAVAAFVRRLIAESRAGALREARDLARGKRPEVIDTDCAVGVHQAATEMGDLLDTLAAEAEPGAQDRAGKAMDGS